MSRVFQSFWAELNVARLNHQSVLAVLDVFICTLLSPSQIKEEKEVWAWPLFTSYWMFHLFKSYTSPFTSLPESLSFYFSVIAFFTPLPLIIQLWIYLPSLVCMCVCVFLCLFLCVCHALSLWNWGMCVLQILCQWDVGRVQTGLGYSMWIRFGTQVRLDHHTRKDLPFLLHPTDLLPLTSSSLSFNWFWSPVTVCSFLN